MSFRKLWASGESIGWSSSIVFIDLEMNMISS
jgi:hypothetical protein